MDDRPCMRCGHLPGQHLFVESEPREWWEATTIVIVAGCAFMVGILVGLLLNTHIL